MLTKGGVKLLDFGLAKLRPDSIVMPGTSETRAVDPLTARGTIVGTLQYMSPEQLEGKEADQRADIFAFGAVLYEMLTGARAFAGDSQASVISAIMSSEPPSVIALQPLASRVVDRIVRTCLIKDRDERWASMHDVLLQLKWIDQDRTLGADPTVAPSRGLQHWAPWLITVLAVSVAAAVWIMAPRHAAERELPRHFLSVVPPAGTTLATEDAPAVSPDGLHLAFVANDAKATRLLYVQALDSSEGARPLPDSDGAAMPFWSPDNRAIGFFAQGKLKTIDLASGRVRSLADAAGARGGTWNRDGVIVFVPSPPAGPFRVSAAGGAAVPVNPTRATGLPLGTWYPSFLPDGRHFLLYTPASSNPETAAIIVGSLDSTETKRLVAARSNAVYARPGYIVFWQEGALVAQQFDEQALEIRGDPIPVARSAALNPLISRALLSVSDNGTLVFFAGAVGQSQLTWFDRDGREVGRPGPTGFFNSLSLSPDDRSVVYDRADPRTGGIDLWRFDFARGEPSRLTFNPSHDMFPLWSADGSRIAFNSLREVPPNLYELSADGSGTERLLLKTPFPKGPTGWSSDGRRLVFNSRQPRTGGDVWVLPLDPPGAAAVPVVATAADEGYGTLSPDGHWLAYVSNESALYQVYLQAFPGPGLRRQVSANGGLEPQWSRDGKELFYLAPDQTLMAVSVRSTRSTVELSSPKALFTTRVNSTEAQAVARHYAVSRDATKFLISRSARPQGEAISVVLNLPATLRR